MSELKDNEEDCSLHSAPSVFAQHQGENHTQVGNYKIRIHVSFLFFYKVQQCRVFILKKKKHWKYESTLLDTWKTVEFQSQ